MDNDYIGVKLHSMHYIYLDKNILQVKHIMVYHYIIDL